MPEPTPPLWRSLLFVPVTNERFVSRARDRGADAVQLDLEDSVAASQKRAARDALPDAVQTVAGGPADVLVRVNRPWRLALPDLEAAVLPGVTALTLPKVPGPQHVAEIAGLVGELERERGLPPGAVRLVAAIEDPAALAQAHAIAAASPRVAGLTLGGEDFALAIGVEPDEDVLLSANQAIVFGATAAGVTPLGTLGSIASFADPDAYREMVRRSRRFGFQGASAIHPNQVPILNEEFAPSGGEVEEAERIVAAFEDAERRGEAAVAVDGRMVDVPVVERARRTVARRDAIESRAGRPRQRQAHVTPGR
ncbi:MAG: CoA ester lyase [bacterium]|jgi:citrate lyase subunit beta/citryl-CoA lyase|nr:CoA ester lyase [bacterium]